MTSEYYPWPHLTSPMKRWSMSHTVTVPDEIRTRLDIRPGDTLRWTLTDDGSVRVVVVSQRYGALSDLDPVDTDMETDAIELEREFGRP